MRLHPHGAGRLQRRAQSRRLDRAPFHGHHRRRQMAAASGASLDAGDQSHRARARTGKRDRLFLRPQCRRHAARQGLRRPDLRPHRAQGRPDRHRNHQPSDGTGLGAADPPPGGTSRRGADPLTRRRAIGGAVDRRALGRLPLRVGASRVARHRRRSDHVSLPHPVRRQEHGRARHGAAPRAAAARHGDGAIPSHRVCSPDRTPA